MTEIEKTSDKPKSKEMEAKPLEYFKPMVGTRHTDPEDGNTYETTKVKTNKQGYIVAYRREFCKGKLVGIIDGPYYVADIYEYTKKNVDNMVRLTGMASDESSPVGERPFGRTVEPLTSGGTREWLASRSGDDELLTTGKTQTTNRSRDPGVTSSEDLSTANVSAQPKSSLTKKRKRRYGTYIAESETAAMLSQVITALAASIDSGDSFTQLATEEIYKRQSLVPTPEHLAQADYEPSHRKYMLMWYKHESWQQG
jgi:hypothetical protein